MGKANIYKIVRFFFGVYILWLGLIGFNDIESKQNFTNKSVEKFDIILKDLDLTFLPSFLNLPEKLNLDLNRMKIHSLEIIYLQNSLLVAGGLLCAFGFSIAKPIIMIALFIEFTFIYNIFYWIEEKMKVNVLKYMSILGGVLHIA
jgi:hypothetical protein